MDSFGPYIGPIFFNISLNVKHSIVPLLDRILFLMCALLFCFELLHN